MTNKKCAQDIRVLLRNERTSDQVELEKLAELIEARKYVEALSHYEAMDTFLRDVVPNKIVFHIYAKRAGGTRIIMAHVRLKDCDKVFESKFKPGVVANIPIDVLVGASEKDIAENLFQARDDILRHVVEVLFTSDDKEIAVL